MKISMSMSKAFFYVFMGLLTLFQTPWALSMEGTVLPVVPTTGGKGTVVASVTGDQFKFSQEDLTELKKTYLDEYFNRNREDKEYFENKISLINAQYQELVTYVLQGVVDEEGNITEFGPIPLSQMAQGAYDRQFATATEYFQMKNKLTADIRKLRALVKSITSISEGALPSATTLAPESLGGSDSVEIPGWRKLNFTPIVEFYEKEIIQIENEVNNLSFRINFEKFHGQYVNIPRDTGKSLSWDFSGTIITLDNAEISRMTTEIRRLKSPASVRDRATGQNLKKSLDTYGQILRSQVQQNIYRFGTSEKYRWRDEGDAQRFQTEFNELVEYFWVRSFVRVSYGVPLGTFSIAEYKKSNSWANLITGTIDGSSNIDIFLNDFRFNEQMTKTEDEAKTSRHSIEQYQEVYDQRASKIFGGDTSLVAKANSFVTFALGERAKAEVINMVLRLIAADITEEIFVIRGDLQSMYNFYVQRYQMTDELSVKYDKMACRWDPEFAVEEVEFCDEDGFGYTDTFADGSVRGAYETVRVQLIHYQANLQTAHNLERELRVMLDLKNSVVGKKRDKRRKKILRPRENFQTGGNL